MRANDPCPSHRDDPLRSAWLPLKCLDPTAVPSPVRRRYTYVGHACVEKSGHARVMPMGQAEQIDVPNTDQGPRGGHADRRVGIAMPEGAVPPISTRSKGSSK